MQATSLECRLSSAAIPACSAAANEEFEQAVKEQAGARVDPTVTRTSRLGIAFVDRSGGTPAYVWKPVFSTKKTYCGTVLGEPSTDGSFGGPANDERIRVLASEPFRSVGSVAASLAGDPPPDVCGNDDGLPREACLVSAVTQPVLPSGFLPTRGTRHCAFGAVVNDYTGPFADGRPEIHPLQTQWWTPKPGQWVIKGSQDGSQRFTVAGWSGPRHCLAFTCDPPPDGWRNFAAHALPHAVEIAFELDLREPRGTAFTVSTFEADNAGLTASDEDWGTKKDKGPYHDLIVDDRLVLQVNEGSDATNHVDLREVCRSGTLLRGYLRVAFVTGSAPLLEDASGTRYGRKTIHVARARPGEAWRSDSPAQYPRAARLGARAPRWSGAGIHDDVGVRQDLRSWREGFRLVEVRTERAGSIPFREATPLRTRDWVDAAVLADVDLLRDRGRVTLVFANRDKESYSISVGSNPPRPTFDLEREHGQRVIDTDAAPALVRLAGGVATAWPALAGLYDVVRYSSLDLHVKPGYLDANTAEGTDLSGPLNDALNTPADARPKVFGSATPFKAAWRLKAYDAETREEVPVRDGQPDGSAAVFTLPGEPDGLTGGSSLRVHFPDRQGRIVNLSVEVTLTDPAGYGSTRRFELTSHVGWIRAPADWQAWRGPLSALAAVNLGEVSRDAGLLNGTAARAAVLTGVPPRRLQADALWTYASRIGLAHTRLEVGTLRTLIALARDYARSATNP
jgi:hypothetical protein